MNKPSNQLEQFLLDDDERDYRQQRPRYDDPVVRLRKDVLSVAESVRKTKNLDNYWNTDGYSYYPYYLLYGRCC